MYFYNYHVDPDLIMSIYEVAEERGMATNDLALLEETHNHMCQINEPYLDAAFRAKYEEAEELAITNFDYHGITIKVTDGNLDSLLRAIEANEDIQWNN